MYVIFAVHYDTQVDILYSNYERKKEIMTERKRYITAVNDRTN